MIDEHREPIECEDDAVYNENYKYTKYNQECHSEGASKGTSISELAGQRLYAQALETRKKIDELREREKTSIYVPQLDMATRGYISRELIPRSIDVPKPRYLELFEHSKVKKTVKPKEDVPLKSLNTVVPYERCNRLYALSASKQQEGKKRRREIIKSKMKPPPPFSHQQKISLEEASKIYERGMKHLISIEMKRMEAAVELELPYNSPLVHVGMDKKGGRYRK